MSRPGIQSWQRAPRGNLFCATIEKNSLCRTSFKFARKNPYTKLKFNLDTVEDVTVCRLLIYTCYLIGSFKDALNSVLNKKKPQHDCKILNCNYNIYKIHLWYRKHVKYVRVNYDGVHNSIVIITIAQIHSFRWVQDITLGDTWISSDIA